MFRNRLTRVYRHRSKQARRLKISCFRVYDHDLPEFPFCIERYGDKIYLAEYLRRHGMDEAAHESWLKACLETISQVLELPVSHIYLRERKKMGHREEQYEKIDGQRNVFTVVENGLKFLVNLSDYLDTGLFLDHRITRELAGAEARDKNVLNLFCYTGSFSVYAAAGGARTVTSVDLSRTYLKWAEDNFSINLLKDPDRYRFIHADVKQYLKSLSPGSFDLVIMDPPTFSNSKRMKDFLDIQRDHVELLNDVIRATAKGGIIYFSTNYSRFVLEKDQIKASEIRDITGLTTPFDFEGKLKRWCYKLIV